MKFSYKINKSIPVGAWCAIIERGNEIISVEIGSAVEHTTNFFVQGVWDGEYSDGNFYNAHFACCSGGNVNICKSGHFFQLPTICLKQYMAYNTIISYTYRTHQHSYSNEVTQI